MAAATSFISRGRRVITQVTAGRPTGAASAPNRPHVARLAGRRTAEVCRLRCEPFVDDERERVNESLSRWWVLLMVAVLLLLLAFVVHVSK